MLDAELDCRFCALDGVDANMATDPGGGEDAHAFEVVQGLVVADVVQDGQQLVEKT